MAHSDSPRTNWLPAERWLLAGVLAFTLLVRGSVLWVMRGNLEQDPDAYREIAENLLRHGQFAVGGRGPIGAAADVRLTAYRPPLYPVILSNLPIASGRQLSLVKVAALHLLFGVATVGLTWLTARRLCIVHQAATDEMHQGAAGTQRAVHCAPLMHHTLAPLLAGLVVACDPILLNQQALVMTETLAAFLAILSLWCLSRFDDGRWWFNAALAGGAIGLAVLCRPTFLPWLGLVGLGMLLVRGRNSEFRKVRRQGLWLPPLAWRLLNVAALGIAAAAVISPWVVRNYRIFGKPIATTTHGGYTLYLANNEDFYRWLATDSTGLPWDSRGFDFWITLWDIERFNPTRPAPAPEEHVEVAMDREAYARASQAMRDEPWMATLASLYRWTQLWSPLPHKLTANESRGRRLLRAATAAWYCGIYLLAAVGVWRLRWRLLQPPWVWGVLLCLAFTAVHTFYWTNLRMRAPLMPFIAIVAAAAIRNSNCSGPNSTAGKSAQNDSDA